MNDIKKRYDDKFKTYAIKRLINEDVSAVDLAKELNIDANLLRQWKKRYLQYVEIEENESEKDISLEEENIILKSKYEKLKNDLKMLKRAFIILLQEKK